jgi:tagatose 1,6-diphosphate aldolase
VASFAFNNYGTFSDGEIDVVVQLMDPGNPGNDNVPAYDFGVRLAGQREPVGRLGLRLGSTEYLEKYLGHIGYGIAERHRGHGFAAKACRLVRPVAIDHGFTTLWITCNPDNQPSRRTCEALGCELVEIVDLPVDCNMYRRGERRKCRYRWDL